MLWGFAVVILKLSGICRVLFLLAGKGHGFPGREGELCFLAQPFVSSLPWLGAWLPWRARCGSLGQGEPGEKRQRRY